MFTTIKYILLVAIRDKLFIALAISIALIFMLSQFIGSLTLAENSQMQLTIYAGLIRILIIAGMVIFCASTLKKSLDNKEIEFLLTKPISRNKLIFSYIAGLWIVGILLSLLATIWLGSGVFSISMMCEIIMMISIASAIILITRNANIAIFSSLAIYILGRLSGFLLYFADKNLAEGNWDNILNKSLMAALSIIPRFDMYGKTIWLQDIDINYSFMLQTAIFIPLILLALAIDLRKKEL